MEVGGGNVSQDITKCVHVCVEVGEGCLVGHHEVWRCVCVCMLVCVCVCVSVCVCARARSRANCEAL